MKIVPLDEVAKRDWWSFCHASGAAWFWHTPAGHLGDQVGAGEELSFAVENEGRLIALAPMPSAGASRRAVVPYPAVADGLPVQLEQELAVSLAREAAARVSRTPGLHALVREIDPLVSDLHMLSVISAAVTVGWLDESLISTVVDLTSELPEIFSRFSHGHRRNIRRGTQLLTCGEDDDGVLFPGFLAQLAEEFGEHAPTAEEGRRLIAWQAAGYGRLFCAWRNDVPVGYAFVIEYKGRTLYHLAVNNRSSGRLPVGHVLQWHAMQKLKDRGATAYHLGVRRAGPLPYDDDRSEKTISIGEFKRQFGGIDRLRYRQVLYCDGDTHRAMARQRQKR